jgi:hypothetical protein
MGGRTDPLEVPSLPFYSIGGAGSHFPDLDEEGNAIYPVNSRMPRRVLGVLPWVELGKGDVEALEVHGLGGEWFDSRDVEGYLKLHGVDVNGGLFPMQHIQNGETERVSSQSYVLDVEGFFSREFSQSLQFFPCSWLQGFSRGLSSSAARLGSRRQMSGTRCKLR